MKTRKLENFKSKRSQQSPQSLYQQPGRSTDGLIVSILRGPCCGTLNLKPKTLNPEPETVESRKVPHLQSHLILTLRCRANSAYTRQSRQDSGLGAEVQVLKSFSFFRSSLDFFALGSAGAGAGHARWWRRGDASLSLSYTHTLSHTLSLCLSHTLSLSHTHSQYISLRVSDVEKGGVVVVLPWR